MTPEARKAQREYKRKWQQQNKDKVREQQARYWEKKAAEMREKSGENGNVRSDR